MCKYRINEEIINNKSSFYPQKLVKIHEQRRSVINPNECIFELVDGWVTMSYDRKGFTTYNDALEIINLDKSKNLGLIKYIEHNID
jgi:hypothetical protein